MSDALSKLALDTERNKPRFEHHYCDLEGDPDGGVSHGMGYTISWQKGPLKVAGSRNGAFVEDVLDAVKSRLQFYQDSKFNHAANQTAIDNIETALFALRNRMADRIERGVAGTHEV